MTQTVDTRNWVVYLLECRGGGLYCGVTNNLEKRLDAHRAGEGSKYVRAHLPFTLAAVSGDMSKTEAMRLEYFIKLADRDQKIRLVQNAGRGRKKKENPAHTGSDTTCANTGGPGL